MGAMIPADFQTVAMRVEIATGIAMRVSAADIENPDNKHFHYFCADCYTKGTHVRLKFMKPSEHRYKFEQIDRLSGEKKEGGRELERTLSFPAHFDRWPGAHDHQCDNPVRYSALKTNALILNAQQTGPRSFIFPVRLPAQGWGEHGGKRATDLRSTFRPAGMDLGGLQSAKDMVRLLEHFERDPGLQYFQHFHDGYDVRRFEEFFFESPSAVHAYLTKQGAVGRNNSMIIAYVLKPNTSPQILRDVPNRNGFPDLSMPKLPSGEKLKLIATAMNKETMKEFSAAVHTKQSWFDGAPVLLLGEARIDAENANIVRIDIFRQEQLMKWETDHRFLPKHTPKKAAALDAQMALEL